MLSITQKVKIHLRCTCSCLDIHLASCVLCNAHTSWTLILCHLRGPHSQLLLLLLLLLHPVRFLLLHLQLQLQLLLQFQRLFQLRPLHLFLPPHLHPPLHPHPHVHMSRAQLQQVHVPMQPPVQVLLQDRVLVQLLQERVQVQVQVQVQDGAAALAHFFGVTQLRFPRSPS